MSCCSACDNDESDAGAVCTELCGCIDGCYDECLEVTTENGAQCVKTISIVNDCHRESDCKNCNGSSDSCVNCQEQWSEMIDVCGF